MKDLWSVFQQHGDIIKINDLWFKSNYKSANSKKSYKVKYISSYTSYKSQGESKVS